MTIIPENFAVWSEIPCTDIEKAMVFYSKVFDLELKREDAGPNPVVTFPTKPKGGVAGHLYPGKPAAKGTGPTIHFAVPDNLEATLERLKAQGGEVVSDIITLPVGRFSYCLDRDGNSIGLFQR